MASKTAKAIAKANKLIVVGVTRARLRLFERLSQYDSGLSRRLAKQADIARQEIEAISGLSRAQRNRRIASLSRRRILQALRREEREIASATVFAATRGVEAGTTTVEAANALTRFVAADTGNAAIAVDVVEPEVANTARFARTFRNPKLSSTLRRGAARTSERMAVTLQRSMQQGESVVEAATAMMAVESPIVHLPRYVENLIEAMEGGNPGAIRDAGKRALREARQLGLRDPRAATTLRNSAAELANTAEAGRAADVARELDYFIQQRARYQARVVARTEMSAAFTEAYQESVRESPNVRGMKWNLSGMHPTPDVCDMYASVDSVGLGPGVFSAGSLQPMPAHPSCLCFYTAELLSLDEIANDRVDPPGESETNLQWLEDQSRDTQDSILGPGRGSALRGGGDRAGRVVRADGQLAPLYEVQGRPRPRRRLGTRVDVRATSVGRLLPPPTPDN